MFEQRFAKHALNSVLEISKLISLSHRKNKTKNVSLSSNKSTPFHWATGLREKKKATAVV